MPTLPQSKWTRCNYNNNAVLKKHSQNTAAVISKEDQRSWLKIECARGRNARQCYEGLQEACSEHVLPNRTVARWVKAFKEGWQNVTDMPRPSHPAWQCKGACSKSCDWFVVSLGLGSALPPPLFSRFKPLWLRSHPQNERTTSWDPLLHSSWHSPGNRLLPSQHQCQQNPMASTSLGMCDTQWWWLHRRPVKLKTL